MTKNLDKVDADIMQLLPALRREARLSQKELADLAGLARSAISAIERRAAQPKATTLRLIAGALATDGTGQRDDEREQEYYERLMRASGYLPIQSRERPSPYRSDSEWTDDELRAALQQLAKDPEIAALIAEAARKYPNMTPGQRTFFVEALRRL